MKSNPFFNSRGYGLADFLVENKLRRMDKEEEKKYREFLKKMNPKAYEEFLEYEELCKQIENE